MSSDSPAPRNFLVLGTSGSEGRALRGTGIVTWPEMVRDGLAPAGGLELTHRLFYVLLLALPLTGLIAASKPGRAWVELVGGMRLPAIPLGDDFGDAHEVLVFVTIAMVVLHVAAGLWHQFIRKDHAAGRMPPFPVHDEVR